MVKRICEKCGEEFEDLDSDRCPNLDCGGNLIKTDRKWTTMYVHKDLLGRVKKLLDYGDTPESFLKRAVESEEIRRLKEGTTDVHRR